MIYASDLERPSSELPSKAKVVICGGGAQGAAIAYKLAQRGLGSDVVLIEQVSSLKSDVSLPFLYSLHY